MTLRCNWNVHYNAKSGARKKKDLIDWVFPVHAPTKSSAVVIADGFLREEGMLTNDYFKGRAYPISEDEQKEAPKAEATENEANPNSEVTRESAASSEPGSCEETQEDEPATDRQSIVDERVKQINAKLYNLGPGERLTLENIPNDVYRASLGYSTSNLKTLLNGTAEEMRAEMDGKIKKSSASLTIGSAFHCLTLEPHLFADEFVMMPEYIKAKRGKDWTAFKEANEGKEVLSAEQWQQVQGMAEKAKEAAPTAFNGGKAEVSCWLKHESGLVLKARADYLNNGVIIDLKSAQDVTDEGIFSAFDKWLYHLQQHVYKLVFGVQHFAFCFTKVEYPHSTRFPVMIEEGDVTKDASMLFDRAISQLTACDELNIWPGYKPEPLFVEPGYKMRRRIYAWENG